MFPLLMTTLVTLSWLLCTLRMRLWRLIELMQPGHELSMEHTSNDFNLTTVGNTLAGILPNFSKSKALNITLPPTTCCSTIALQSCLISACSNMCIPCCTQPICRRLPYRHLYGDKPNIGGVPKWGQHIWVHDNAGSKLNVWGNEA